MEKTSSRIAFVRIAWDCFVDLGITVVYATIAGLLIVGVVATDDGTTSLLRSALYAALLPASVAALIGIEAMLRMAAERRARRRRPRSAPSVRADDLDFGLTYS